MALPPDLATILAPIMVQALQGGPRADDAEASPLPVCALCEDRGFRYPALPADDPAYGKVMACECRLKRLAERHEELLWKSWTQSSGVPRKLRDKRLETHPNLTEGENPGLLARLRAADLAADSWFIWGPTGRGKSGLVAGYAWTFLCVTGQNVLWRTVPGLLAELRASYDRREEDEGQSEADLLHAYRTAGLLVLDDVGREASKSEWASDRLYQIIGGRSEDERPMLFTSKYPDLAQRLDADVAWRIVEMCGKRHIVQLRGSNLRNPFGGEDDEL